MLSKKDLDMRQFNRVLATAFLFLCSAMVWSTEPQSSEYRAWVVEMKERPKGPFSEILWYCNDGNVLPPKAYACKEHGGGKQHGKINSKALTLQNNGYLIANILAGVDAQKRLLQDGFNDWYNQLLIEKFLVKADNGWIFEKAQFYRGAIQEEDERDGGRSLLMALIAESEWTGLRYPALRIGAQLLPHGEDSVSIQEVRQMSMSLNVKDEGFKNLRTKIHLSPDAGDAQRVLDYAKKISNAELRAKYSLLAQEINQVFQPPPLPELLEQNAKIFSAGPWLQELLREAIKAYQSENTVENHYVTTAHLLSELREALPRIRNIKARLRVLDLSLIVETVNFKASTELLSQLPNASRRARVFWLENAAIATYGSGLINKRGLDSIRASIKYLKHERVPLNIYLQELKYLAAIPNWGTQGLRFQFYQSMLKLAEIEPIAKLFIQDVMRASPFLFFSQTVGSLSGDANRLAGVSHKVFGRRINSGVQALNPGLARGTLYTKHDIKNTSVFDPQGIYLLPETISDLPPVAGIITAGSGNFLSHIQLLARNLGIPNVSVNEGEFQRLHAYEGESVVLAVSPNGLVELARDSAQERGITENESEVDGVLIRPNIEKLDLTVREFIDLSSLRASDSGRIVGPKAAKLGELKHHYPNNVANGIAIPFGIFREAVLDKPYGGTKQTIFEWMEQQYSIIQSLPVQSEQRKKFTESFRAEVYQIISNADMGNQYRNKLRKKIIETFGDPTVGVFIRSDTNVEDLPEFTGAGLNLTLFNVVGIDNIFEGIKKVWASPFTVRAFSWRQALMELPQHVYPAILLMQTVANDKSSVMVTQDVDTGDLNTLSIAVNEGVGGGVDGQSAESLRINLTDGSIRLLASATAPTRKVPSPIGGMQILPVSGSDSVLKVDEINRLIQFVKALPNSFPMNVDEQGVATAIDVEFGFSNGRLQLFQLRPFVQNKKAQNSVYLRNMDKALYQDEQRIVIMSATPEE